jgi:hypothetical protein
VQLDVVECWDRNVARALEAYVVGLMGKQYEVTAVLARRDYPHALQRLLHDRSSQAIVRVLSRYEHVDVAVVPYFLHKIPPGGPAGPSGDGDRGPAPAAGQPPALS